jgi:hypothetical protein
MLVDVILFGVVDVEERERELIEEEGDATAT